MNISHRLSEIEQGRLVQAIESAIDIDLPEQFHAWLKNAFCALLPHESVVCLEVGDHGNVRQVDFLHHGLVDAEVIDFLCNPEHGLAMRLTRFFRAKTRMSYFVDGKRINALLETYTGNRHPGSYPLANAFIHRTRFLSGAAYYFILFNVPAEHVQRSPHLFKLLSSHLKMALSRVIDTLEMNSHVTLTERELDILQGIVDGKSSREIGLALGISPITVKNHISKIYRKLDVQSRSDAVSRGRILLGAVHNAKGVVVPAVEGLDK